jgi:hypothetical protein
MLIASRGLESQLVPSPAATNAGPSNTAPTSGGAPRVAHLDLSSQSFGHLPVPSAVFQPQPPRERSLFPKRARRRTYSHSCAGHDRVFAKTDLHILEILRKRSIAGKLFADYWLSLREELSKAKKATFKRKKR